MTTDSGSQSKIAGAPAPTTEAIMRLQKVKELWAAVKQQEALNACQGLIAEYPSRTEALHFYALGPVRQRWHKVDPANRLLEVSYENVLQDTLTEARRIIEFVGLQRTDIILDFHKTHRAVRTASFDQVTKPIYSTSVERWEPYAPWLAPPC